MKPYAITLLALLGGLTACQDEFDATVGICPVVLSTNPAHMAIGVPPATTITMTFNEAMNPATLVPENFSLTAESNNLSVAAVIAGTMSYDAATFTWSFDPTDDLPANSVFTGRVEPKVKDEMGNALQEPYIWSFSTGVQPFVASTTPVSQATDVPLGSDVTATFNVAMDPTTITTTTFTLAAGANPVAGAVSYAGTTATFNPNTDLTAGTVYTATVTTEATSATGIEMVTSKVWTFTTVAPAAPAPTVVSTVPQHQATDVQLNADVTATFSENMNTATLTTTSFTVMDGTTPVTGVVSMVGATATFNPTDNLLSGVTYTATITTAAENPTGTALENDYSWTFGTVAPTGPMAVDLRSVEAYGIIAGVGVRNDAGFSVINDMNVGISPGVRSSITGFPPAIVVNGAIHASDDATPVGIAAILVQAKQDLVDAYLFAEGATSPAPATVSGDQGGLTLAPGIYKSTSTLLVQNGNLTLDAQGDANAVWIFQIASDFTTVGGAGGDIILIGGAQARNVYWQVGSSATIGDNTSFKGTVLAMTSITMNSGAVAEGRMLARNGSVVLTSTNIINKP